MRSKLLSAFDEALADVPDTAPTLIVGFGPGTPWNLARCLVLQRHVVADGLTSG
jgi:hypothetical protein